jgi:recombination protein RecT
MANNTIKTPQVNENNPLTQFSETLKTRQMEIKSLLPKSIKLEAFKRVVITALQEKPELLAADHKSLFDACLKCAKDGLLPDGKEAAFAIFNSNIAKKNEAPIWIKKIAYMPMVGGIKKQIWRTGEYTYISANAVYENDEFDYCLGDNEYIKHKPTMSNRGDVVAAYAIVKTKNGEFMRSVLTKEDIDYIRSKSKGKDGDFWNDWYDRMAVKSALRRLAGYLNLSVDFGDYDDSEVPVYEEPKQLVKPEETPALPKPLEEPKPQALLQPEQQPQQPQQKPQLQTQTQTQTKPNAAKQKPF